mgnify:CR=1 FL=1
MAAIFRQIKSGGDRNFAYLIAEAETKEAVLIDPSPDVRAVSESIKRYDFELKYLINTHSHYDHSSGNGYFKTGKEGNPVRFVNCGRDTEIKSESTIRLGDLEIVLIPTPGHTPDSICIKAGRRLITGDTLFVGKIGGTYSEDDAKKEFDSLKKIVMLPPETEIWPGHDCGTRPSSTIYDELRENPFIKSLNDFNQFLWLKNNWASYKKEHGIR